MEEYKIKLAAGNKCDYDPILTEGRRRRGQSRETQSGSSGPFARRTCSSRSCSWGTLRGKWGTRGCPSLSCSSPWSRTRTSPRVPASRPWSLLEKKWWDQEVNYLPLDLYAAFFSVEKGYADKTETFFEINTKIWKYIFSFVFCFFSYVVFCIFCLYL